MIATSVQLSVIVPVGSRYDDVSAVLDAYRTVLDGLDMGYELIYVLDGPRPDVLEILRAEQTRHASLGDTAAGEIVRRGDGDRSWLRGEPRSS